MLNFTNTVSTAELNQVVITRFLASGGDDHHLRRLRQVFAFQVQRMSAAIESSFPPDCKVTRSAGGQALGMTTPPVFLRLGIARCGGIVILQPQRYSPPQSADRRQIGGESRLIPVLQRTFWWAAVSCVWLVSASVGAQDPWPVRPVRLVAPFTPAGATDILARLTADALGRRLGQNVIVENRPGAGAVLGGEVVARATADGYTLLMAPSTVYAAGVSLYARPRFDLMRDFTPVATVAFVPHVLVVDPALGANDVRQLIAIAKGRTDGLIMASQGVGTISHLEGELFQHMAGIRMVHVPYKGSAPAHLDLIAGRVNVMFDSVAAALQHIRSGKLKAVAVTSATRIPALPEVPTMAEAALPGYLAESWLGVFAPAATPRPVIARLVRELSQLAADPVFRQRLAEQGFESRALGPDAYAALMRRETEYWAVVVKRAGISLD